MKLKELMRQYFMGETDAISVIRTLSGMFDPKHAASLLSLICTITRHDQGDIDTKTFNDVWKFNLNLEFNDGNYPQQFDAMTIEELNKEKVDLEKQLNELQEKGQKKALTLDEADDVTTLSQDISLIKAYIKFRGKK